MAQRKTPPSHPRAKSPARRARSSVGGASVPNGKPGAPGGATTKVTGRWTFLSNHGHVLLLLFRDPTIVLREVADRVGITERAVQRIILDLEVGGFIERERIGRRNRYSIRGDSPLRHPIEGHRTIQDLIGLLD